MQAVTHTHYVTSLGLGWTSEIVATPIGDGLDAHEARVNAAMAEYGPGPDGEPSEVVAGDTYVATIGADLTEDLADAAIRREAPDLECVGTGSDEFGGFDATWFGRKI